MKYDIFDKNELEIDYLINNLSREQMLKKYKINSITTLKRILAYYNIKKPIANLSKDELYADYIINNMSLDDLCKKYNMSSSGIGCYLKKYNIKKSIELQTKNRNATLLNKYNVSSPAKLPKVKEKIKKTNVERYGVENVFQNEDIKKKIKNTLIKKYGITNPMDNDNFSKKQAESMRNTNIERYGIPWYCMSKECTSVSHGSNSKPNLQFEEKLIKNKIEYQREFPIEDKMFDFKIENVLIEIDPSITHNSTYGYHEKNPININYHKDKSKLAKDNGFQCIHIFDWDNEDKVINLLKDKQPIYARECKIKEIKNVDEFLNENHLQGTCKGQTIKLGLFYNNELVEVMTFGKPRYNKKYEYELLRLCSSNMYAITGGANKLFKYFIHKYNPKSIISYCDNSKFNGKIYLELGFSLLRNNNPSKHWYNIKTHEYYTDNLIRQHGFSRIINKKEAKDDNLEITDNNLLMENAGFVAIYDCGQDTWVYKVK